VKPWIGITGRSIPCEDIEFIPRRLTGTAIDLHFRDYAIRVAEAGGVPVQLSSSADPEQMMERLDGLLLSGGNDIDPRRYGQSPDPRLGIVDPVRDEFEWALLDNAVHQGKPVFGICRGMQWINVYFGGSLVQDLGEMTPMHDGPHTDLEYRFHSVTTIAQTRAARVYGSHLSVTSAHHQAVDTVGSGLKVSGYAEDGTIEIVEAVDRPILGVQWHGEWTKDLDPGFSWLTATSSRREGI